VASSQSTDPQKASKAELARILGVSRQAVGDLVARGLLTEGDNGRIDVAQARIELANNVRPSSKTAQALTTSEAMTSTAPDTAAPADEKKPEALSFHTARTFNEVAMAGINQLKLRELQGDLIRVDAVRSALATVLASTRDSLMQIPARLSPVLAAETNAATIHDMLAKELHQSLAQLAAAPDRLSEAKP
jgi:small-conductance mechanosensitive channel